MKRHQIKMLQTEVGLDKRKEVGLAGLFFWHQLVHYYSALMAHFSTGVDKTARLHSFSLRSLLFCLRRTRKQTKKSDRARRLRDLGCRYPLVDKEQFSSHPWEVARV